MKTHNELIDESYELEDLVSQYKSENNYEKLEETLLNLIDVYDGLNYCEEDDYLEYIIDCYTLLCEINKQNNSKLLIYYEKIIEYYDYLIQRDRSEGELLNKHIEKFNIVYNEFLKINNNFNLEEDYPRLKQYVK